jgi:pimeloyl-ACP methyl ester carboxylesterase
VFDGFETRRVPTSGAEIHLRLGGGGPPLLLLHGYPQTHVMWHRVAPYLAERFTVAAADLRGYGDSTKPESDPAHATYSKRAMARDQVEVMSGLGFERFAVVGHDRGARVAHRMALDHPDRVERAAVLDICPTLAMYEGTDMAFASGYYHWFFLIQPYRPAASAWARARTSPRPSTPRRWRSTSAVFATPPPSTPAARTTGLRRPSTWSTTGPTWAASSPVPCWRCGGARAWSASSSTSWGCGARARTT